LVNRWFLTKEKLYRTNKQKRTSRMPRPNKIVEPSKQYNLLMKQSQYDRLAEVADKMQQKSLEQVSVADLIRDSIDVYLEVLEDEK